MRVNNVLPEGSGFAATPEHDRRFPHEVWGTGNAAREVLYVEDCAKAVVQAAASYDETESVNLGSGSELQISEAINTVVRLTGFRGQIRWQTNEPAGQPRRSLDVSRTAEKVWLTTCTPFEFGLARTIECRAQTD